MYAVIACFDTKTESTIRTLWYELKVRGISEYAFEVENRTPHVTLASYETLMVEPFIHQMDAWYPMQSGFEVMFQSIGSFLSTSILYLAPVVDEALLHFHGLKTDMKKHLVYTRCFAFILEVGGADVQSTVSI